MPSAGLIWLAKDIVSRHNARMPMRSDVQPHAAAITPISGSHTGFIRGGMLVLLIGVVTLVSQHWVGGATIYRDQLETRREQIHQYVLENRLPPGVTWTSFGGNGINIRLVTVLAAEGMHRVAHLSVLNSYYVIDTVALFSGLLLLFAYLRRWFSDEYCLIGVLFVAAILPLTYVLFAFHPWDRPSMVLWLAAAYLVRDRRVLLFALIIGLAVAVKYDAIVLPGLFFLAYVTRRDWLSVTVTTGLLFVVTVGVFALLIRARPGGFESNPGSHQMLKNLSIFAGMRFTYPPLLAFSVPLLAALIGFRSADRFVQASAVFGVLLFVPFFVGSNFAEFRAEVPVLILILPAALHGARLLMQTSETVPSRALLP